MLWTADDIAEFLTLAPRTVKEKLVHRPDFPAPLRLSSKVKRWFRDEVIEWAMRQR